MGLAFNPFLHLIRRGRAQIVGVASPVQRTLPVPVRLLLFASVPALLVGLATIGYRLAEPWSWFDSLYVAVLTLTSMGYGQKYAVSTLGRCLTMVLALGGISTVAVALTELLATAVRGELGDFLGRWRMKKRIDSLEQQVIVCGYGHVGRYVCAEILSRGIPVVAIDRRAEPLRDARAAGAIVLQGDATDEAILQQAGIGRARALVAAAATDGENVLITMTARLLRPALPIVSCVEASGGVAKLRQAGATRTACPDAIAGGQIAAEVLLGLGSASGPPPVG
jgi:voltage-gated potassium channel